MNKKRKRKLPLIMIADADEEERALMRAVLKLVGFDVIEALNGPQAVRLATEQLPDLLVIDLTLPHLSGTGAIERIRKQSLLPGLPILAVSRELTSARSLVSEPSTVYLPKPIEFEEFYAHIDRFLPGQMTSLARSRCLPL